MFGYVRAMQMNSQVRYLDGGRFVVLGPCPGCDDWQLEYSEKDAQTYVSIFIDHTAGPEGMRVHPETFYAVVEEILQEHAAECPHLRDLLAEA